VVAVGTTFANAHACAGWSRAFSKADPLGWNWAFLAIEKLLLVYFGSYLLIDLLLFLYALRSFRKQSPAEVPAERYAGETLSIIVPGYNEAVTIVPCLEQLMTLEYADYELIFVNDGSKDATLEKVRGAFDLVEVSGQEGAEGAVESVLWEGAEGAAGEGSVRPIDTARIRSVQRSRDGRLTVIDKENGGKADSVNAGINCSRSRFVCTVDADSILDPRAIQGVLAPMLRNPENFVSGGQLAAANDVVLERSRVVGSRMPRNLWVLWQIVEYIKSFMISKVGLSRIDSLLVMSGAFSVYRREDLLAVGGFLSKQNRSPYLAQTIGVGKHTVCEDMEIVVRLWRYYRDRGVQGKATFVPSPVCWTEVPENGRSLFRQRARWHLGLAETLKIHRDMMFEPRYGMTALFALPYSFFFELLSPLVKVLALLFLLASSLVGLLDGRFVLLMGLGVLLLAALFTSTITVFIEAWSQRQGEQSRDALRYRNFGDWVWLLLVAIAGDFTYAFFKMGAQLKGIVDFLRKKSEWNKFERKGFAVAPAMASAMVSTEPVDARSE
jgi:cellulose synthase/poly-beta-1,6-N-acetylglucosamine synthase-like glycosyltransferase